MKGFLICGGDLRQAHLANSLAASGYIVKATGFSDTEVFDSNIKVQKFTPDIVKEADVVILPLPCSSDDETLSTPMQKEIISLKSLFSAITPNQIVVGGKITDKQKDLAERHNIVIHDYLKREEMAIFNAIPTVEGAIQIAMENMPVTVHGLNVLCLGFGRIGKLLCEKFSALGANVTAEARKVSDLAWIKSYGYKGINLTDLGLAIGGFDLIINTVPTMIVTEEIIKNVKPEALIIDLASKPGGVDMEAASRYGKKVIWALSLPGTVAPVTAGIIIKDTILNILDELEAKNVGLFRN